MVSARGKEILAKAADHAKSQNVTLVVEYLNRFECYFLTCAADTARFCREVGHSHLKMMYDTFHANIEEKSQVGAIKTIAPVLAHVHLSENDRGTPGSGHVDFREAISTLREAGYDGWMTVEAFSRADPDFANAINVWREYSKPWDMAEQGLTFIRDMGRKHGL